MTTAGSLPEGRFLLEAEGSVKGMLAVMDRVTLSETGRLWRWNGEASNWYAPQETANERQEITQQ